MDCGRILDTLTCSRLPRGLRRPLTENCNTSTVHGWDADDASIGLDGLSKLTNEVPLNSLRKVSTVVQCFLSHCQRPRPLSLNSAVSSRMIQVRKPYNRVRRIDFMIYPVVTSDAGEGQEGKAPKVQILRQIVCHRISVRSQLGRIFQEGDQRCTTTRPGHE